MHFIEFAFVETNQSFGINSNVKFTLKPAAIARAGLREVTL